MELCQERVAGIGIACHCIVTASSRKIGVEVRIVAHQTNDRATWCDRSMWVVVLLLRGDVAADLAPESGAVAEEAQLGEGLQHLLEVREAQLVDDEKSGPGVFFQLLL